MAPAPRPVAREAQRAAEPAASAARPRSVIVGLGIGRQVYAEYTHLADTDSMSRALSDLRAILTV